VTRGVGRLASALVVLGMLWLPLASPSPTPGNPYGVLIFVGGQLDDSVLDRMLTRTADAGIGAVRTDFFWHLIEPTRGVFRWDRYDALMRAAQRHSIEVLGILDYSAAWASSDPAGQDLKYPPKDPAAFARFAGATAARYRTVSSWEVWNEPDNREFWKGSPGAYASLLAESYRSIKSANPGASVLLGGLAQGGPHDPAFLDSVLQACRRMAARCFDILAFHTHFRSPGDIRSQFQANRRAMSRYGWEAPIWITEASYTSDGRYQNLPGYRDGEPGQARYVSDTVSLSVALGAERVFWAGLSDYDEGEEGPYAASGLLRADYRPKPSYDAYRTLARRTTVSRPDRGGSR
jgi:GH35 family endo-1,4-beta-xylanase